MRLLMLSSDTAAVRGIEGPFWHTLRGFHRYWDRIEVICPAVHGALTPMLFGNVRLHPLSGGVLRSPWQVIQLGLRICHEQPPDLIAIHAYGMQFMAWGGWRLAQRLRRPFVVEVHHIEGVPRSAGPRDWLRRMATLAFLRRVRQTARAFRVVNQAELPWILRHKARIAPEKLKVLYSVYLDRTIFHPMPDIPKTFDVIFVGRLVPNKGLDLLIETFTRLQQKIPTARLLVIGQGPLQRHLLAKLGHCPGFHHIPFLPSAADIAQAYHQARVVVCASYAEGGPRYVVEAMACGLPAVSTPVGLMHEMVQDGTSGFLVRDWSASAMAEKIAALLMDAGLYRHCAANAVTLAAQFDYDRTIAAYALAYRELVAS